MLHIPPHAAPPPRRVPLSVRILHWFGRRAQTAWMTWGVGMVFFWPLVLGADFSFLTFRGTGRATGTITSVAPTGTLVLGEDVRAVDYEFGVAKQTFRGRSFTRDEKVAAGQRVAIEYDERDPGESRITGMGRKRIGPAAALIAIWPAIGLLLIVRDLRESRRHIRLLRDGMFATGTLTSKTKTMHETEAGPVYVCVYDFRGRDGRHHQLHVEKSDPERVADDSPQPLVYDPADPSRASLFEDAPVRPRFDPDGELEGRPWMALLSLAPAAALVALNVVVGAASLLLEQL